jgi:lipid-binding SYLF domain-containing protein
MRTIVPVRIALVACVAMIAPSSMAQEKGKSEAAKLSSESQAALTRLYAGVPFAKALGPKAHAILVFPEITKAGLVVGGQYGEGALLQRDQAVGYYKTTGGSVGLQAGAQKYGYALFFMNAAALKQLDKAGGFEIGVGPSFVVVDEGMGKSVTTTTADKDIYAFIFGQKGLMAGLGIQGNKIAKIQPK